MKYSFLFLIVQWFASVHLIVNANVHGKYTVYEFDQKVDHFNYNTNATFKQRIVESIKYRSEINPPILFYCGNEGDIFAFVNNTGLMWELEDRFKAILIFVEHRYYGESFPKQKSKKDYSYLSIEQALTDFALVIDDLRNSRPNLARSPVIAFGGSYGGMLAVWARIKYPHLIEGAIASSAPIIQFPGAYDCSAFNKVVTKDYENYSNRCSNLIRKTWPAIREIASQADGNKFLNELFQLCKPMNRSDDIKKLINYFGEILVNVAMTDYPNPSTFLKPKPRYPIKEICKIFNNDELDNRNLVKLFKEGIYSIYLNYTGDAPQCIDLEGDSTDLGAEGWNYQSCTETVMPVCSNGVDDFFEKDDFNLTYIENNCREIFGVNLDVNKVRMEYSLQDLRAASNVVFSNGDRDPWAPGGILKDNYKRFNLKALTGKKLEHKIYEYFRNTENDLNNLIFIQTGSIIINIPNACHHEDLRPTGEYDPIELINTRRQETKIIQKWIKDYYAEL